jgi:zinc D-Ala-D-Ala carboxypeptidase
VKLTEHFSWEEVERSPTATEKGIDNTVPENLRANVVKTAEQMEKVRDVLGGRPLRITSWYRCKALNTAIGGSRTSAHMRGLAVDFKPPLGWMLYAAFERLADSDIPFDQLIEERTQSGSFWIHVGFTEGRPRREVLRASGSTLGGPMTYRRHKTA